MTDARHVIEEIAPDLAVAGRSSSALAGPTTPLASDELPLLALLDDWPVSLDRLAARLQAPVGELTGTLARLEVRGLVARGGAGYAITASGAKARGEALRSGA